MAYYNGKKVLSVVRTKYLTPNGDIRITANGAYDVQSYKRALVSVFPSGDTQRVDESRVALMTNQFPATAYPKALLNFFGGMCQKVNQRFSNSDFSNGTADWKTTNDSTFSVTNKIARITATQNGDIAIAHWFTPETKANHKYFVNAKVRTSSQSVSLILSTVFTGTEPRTNSQEFVELNMISYSNSGYPVGTDYPQLLVQNASIGDWFEVDYFRWVDLTDIYGAGNEPTSIDDSRIKQIKNYLAEHPKEDAGSIANAVINKIVSRGFNLIGNIIDGYYIDFYSGQLIASPEHSCTDFVEVTPEQEYFMKETDFSSYEWGAFYDKDKNYICGYLFYPNYSTFIVPSGAHYMRVTLNNTSEACINVSGSVNGSYLPYVQPIEHVIPKTITGENVWNEQWEVGEINGTTGAKANTGVYIRSKDYISVEPDATYSVKSAETIVVYEYSDNAYIGAVYNVTNSVFTTPSNCTRIMIATSSGGTTYNNDISITYVSRLIGDNIWDEDYVVGAFGSDGVFNSGADAISSANFIPVKSSAHYHYQVGTGGYLVILYYDANQTLLSVLFGEARNQSYKTPDNAKYVKFSVVSGYGTTYHDDISIKRDFVAPDGYGLGLSLSLNNHVELASGKFKIVLAKVDLGDLDYGSRHGSYPHQFSSTDLVNCVLGDDAELTDVICDCYPTEKWNDMYDHDINGICIGTDGQFWIRDDTISDPFSVAELKNKVSGKFAVFKLKVPTEIDISEDLAEAFDAEDIITIYPSGSVEFQNDNEIGAPYSLSYEHQVE